MGKINVGRVILGGLLAGLVVNIGEAILNLFVVAQGMESALRARNLPAIGNHAVGQLVIITFVLGIVTVWAYAVARPRFGPGAKTAATVGVAVWFLAYVYGNAVMVIVGFLPLELMTLVTVWGLVEIVLGTIVGAWVYRE